jgi:Protein of unknown function (DUF3426)
MFINCPYCRALVATDPATDLPPPICPQCLGPLRETGQADRSEASDQASPAASLPLMRPQANSAHEDVDIANRRITIDDTADESSFATSTAASPDSEEATIAQTSANAADSAILRMRPDDMPTTPQAFEDDTAGTEAAFADAETTLAQSADPAMPTHDDDTEMPASENIEAAPPIPSPSPSPSAAVFTASTTAASPANRATPRRRTGQATPSFARTGADGDDKRRPHAWPSIAAILALGALLALQLLLADRARLATSAGWRPLLETLCGALSCTLPPWREPAAFTLLQRDVRQHPTVPGALRVSASFRNDARWPQPWPTLELTLSDVNGRAAGERRFEAREYLGGTPEQAMLTSGETATVAMDILEPAAHIVAYDFRFR